MNTPKAHSELSASASERWLNCPPSVALIKEAPEPPESKWSIEGTLAHHHLEQRLLAIWYGDKYKMPKDLKANPDMQAAIEVAVDYVTSIWDEEKQKLFIEEKVDLTFIDPVMFGTGDVFIVEPGKILYAIDYKHGAGKAVDVYKDAPFGRDHNTQLVYYALAMAHRYDYNFKSVVLAIVQPRAQHSKGPIRTVKLTMTELKKYIYIFTKGVERVRSGKGRLFAGPWCYWCPAREHNCPLQDNLKYEKNRELLNSFDE